MGKREWVSERDDQLALWFAEGRHDEDVLAAAQDAGFDLSLDGVADKRGQLTRKINAVLATRGSDILRHISRSSPVVRATEIDQMCDALIRGVRVCEALDQWSRVPKLVETLLRCHDRLQIEVESSPKPASASDGMIDLVREAPPELRMKLVESIARVHEVRREIEERLSPIIAEIEVQDAAH